MLESNPTLAAAMVRAAGDAGCELVPTSTIAGLRAHADRGGWDLVLVDRAAGDLEVLASALTGLPDEVIRLVVDAHVRGTDRNDARNAGFTDAAVRPTRPAQLARLLSLVTEPEPAARGAGASTSR
jgi:DNA-binding response OmpR family regulator